MGGARDELAATITTVWLAEARSRRQPPMPGVMAQIPCQTAAGARDFRFGPPRGRLADGVNGVLLGGRVSAHAWPGDRSAAFPVPPCRSRRCRRHGCCVAPGR